MKDVWVCHAGGRRADPPVAVFAMADVTGGVFLTLRRSTQGRFVSDPDGAVRGMGASSSLTFDTCYGLAKMFALDDDVAVIKPPHDPTSCCDAIIQPHDGVGDTKLWHRPGSVHAPPPRWS